jgi:hypothetical protein
MSIRFFKDLKVCVSELDEEETSAEKPLILDIDIIQDHDF